MLIRIESKVVSPMSVSRVVVCACFLKFEKAVWALVAFFGWLGSCV